MSLPNEFLYELHKNFTGEIRTDAAARILYSTDASIYQIEPLGVVMPRSQEELHAAVELAVKYRIPILPRGAGTSLAGQAVGRALILDCSRWLDRIVEINAEEHYAIVEPGVVLSDLNNAAGKHGLTYGPDPASAERATMGGVIANNATGAHSIVYGMSADHLISADVILGDGGLGVFDDSVTEPRYSNNRLASIVSTAIEIRKNYAPAIRQNHPKTWRNSAGYRLNYLLPWSASKPARWEGEYPPMSRLNLAPLLAGSEGTLAVIRQMKVKLVSKPKHTILAVLSYAGIAEACDDVPRLLTHNPSAIELIPRMILQAARSSPGYAGQMSWLSGDPAALLVVEFSGDYERELLEMGKRCSLDMPLRGYSTTRSNCFIAESKQDQARVWNVRKVGLGLMDSKPQSARPVAFIEDCAIPVERLGEFVREVERILSTHAVEGGMYAHASAGCLHIRPILDLKSSQGLSHLRSISEAVFTLTLSLGGAMSSEHGDGLARSEYLARAYGPEVMDAMRMLKNAADPYGLLNPGKIINAPKQDENLRYGNGYKAHAWEPALSFAREGGFELAVEQCNGQGLCRKASGVMCPSYQGTRDEMYSTRGRANLLRALMSLRGANGESDEATPSLVGRLLRAILRLRSTSTRSAQDGRPRNDMMEVTFQALDLCLACKGCKAECPSGVDMAKLKYEFENEYYKTHRRPLRDYLFGYFDVVAKMVTPFAPLVNAIGSMWAARAVMEKVLGIASQRPLPLFARRMSLRAAARDPGRRSNLLESMRTNSEQEIASSLRSSQRHVVIFFPDVFSRYIEPQVEEAALEVLGKCGYDVRVLPVVGTGASLFSKGFIEAARAHARKTLDLLDQADPGREAFLVGLEPPEIYLLKNDYVDLLPDRAEEIRERARNVWLIDEFLLRSKEFGELRAATSPPTRPFGVLRDLPRGEGGRIFFHPHCHQQAEGPAADGVPSGAEASVALLRACGYDVELSDPGCCGMAGTFGYEAEHYELSMKIAGLRLTPALTPPPPPADAGTSPKSDDGSVGFGGGRGRVASTGAACRMQIRHAAGVEARGTIEWVREALKR